MTAAVPDPRFRDQLAEARRAPWVYNEGNGWVYGPDPDHAGLRYPYVYAADPEQCRILVARLNADAAEVEARVQAAANQRAAEGWQGAADELIDYSKRCAEPNARQITLFYGKSFAARAAALASPAPDPRPDGKACRVVVDGDEDESFLVCLTCNPGVEVCCGHHLAPHDADGCHEMVARVKCQCARRPAPAPRAEEGQ